MTGQTGEVATTPTSRSQTFTVLREMAQTLSLAWDLDTTLALIARKTADLMQADSCTIYLLDPDRETLSPEDV